MKITKRITTMLLIFVFAFSTLCTVGTLSVSADFSDVSEDYVYSEAITSLVDEGIINGYEDGTFKPENTITRAEFSKLLAVASAPTGYVFSATTTAFPDIADMNAPHGWAIPYIAYAVSTKAINGYTDGTFQAGNPVTYGEAIKMIVCTLGYGPVVDTTLTPWYKGYLDIANQIGLTKKAVAVGENPANRGIVAQLVYNMLDCPQLTQTGNDINGNPIYSTEGGSSFGDSKDNAQSDEGVVMGVIDYSLDATSVKINRVQIDDEIFAIGGNVSMDTIKSLIGYRVSYSYTGTGSKQELTKISRLSGYNEEVVIEPWQISDIKSNYIDYYADEDAEFDNKTERISYSDFYVVYNGVPVKPADIGVGFDVTKYFDIESGTLRFFSNDGDIKSAEVIYVESYETYFVNAPSENDGITTIYDKNQKYTGLEAKEINEDDVTSVTKISSKGGKPVDSSLGAIVRNTAVSVAVPYGTTEGTKVIISAAYVTGDVNELSSDYENIVIGSDTYELSPYYQKLLDKGCPDAGFELRDNAKFYLDYLGRIVYSEKNETSDPYGLLIAYAKGGSIDSSNALKVMTTGGKYLEYNMKSKIIVNDGKTMTSDEAIEYFKKTASVQDGNYIIQPVKYRTSGSMFTLIETLDPASPEATLTYSKVGPAFKQGTTTKFSMTTSGTKSTIVFVVPSDITKTDKYKKTSASYFNDEDSYNVTPYEMEGSAARIVLCKLDEKSVVGAQIGASTPVYLVESVTDTSVNGQLVKKLSYKTLAAKDSETKEVVTSDEAEIIAKLEGIQSGDVVKFVVEDGVLTDIVKVYSNGVLTSVSPVGVVQDGNPNHVALSGNGIQNYFQAIVCTINEIDDEGTRMTVIPELYTSSLLDETKLITLNRSTNDVPVYVYETLGNKSGFVSSSTGAIKPYNEFKETDLSVATQALVIVMNEKVVGIYILNN